MALQEISTGYKPEFALGGLYHGFNAANAEDMSQEEILKQFLLNQREQQMQPLDIEKAQLANQGTVFDNMVKELSGAQAQVQNTPEQLFGFGQAKQAGYDKAVRENEVGQLLQPFIKQQLPIEQSAKTVQLDIAKQIADIDKVLAGGADPFGNVAAPNQLPLWEKERAALVSRLGNTPELAGKTALAQLNNQAEFDKATTVAGIAADASRYSAERRASAGQDGYNKLLQSDINTLEPVHAKLVQQVAEARRIAGMVKNEDNRKALASLESELATVTDNLNRSRAELRSRVTGGGSITAQTQTPTVDPLKATVEASGIAYEPTVYQYRVVDGKVQRKKKE